MMGRRRSVTLIEVGVVTAVVVLGGTILTAGLSRTAEDARSAKCLDNLRRAMNAISAYTVDYGGVLPGPLHPAIIRGAHDYGDLPGDPSSAGGTNRVKSLTWLLRPYFPPVGDSATNPSTPNPIVDAVFTCPTAQMAAPDYDFYSGGGGFHRPCNYACNSWGPFTYGGGPYDPSWTEWFHTDPPWYFGIWVYSDDNPDQSRVTGIWPPKKLSTIPNAGAEWAVGDAWFRHVSEPPRRGSAGRLYVGTFPVGGSTTPLPSLPYHGVPPHRARSHWRSGSDLLPKIDFDGWTNQAYFDGHVSAFKGNWQELGDGGTVNPLWAYWGGDYSP
jgi:prepilin-type processing-associated H-X9-DG protein